MEHYILYLKQITHLRDNIKTKDMKFGEWLKIWARWVITHTSLYPPENPLQFLPASDVYDHQFVFELLNYDFSQAEAEQIYTEMSAAQKTILPPLVEDSLDTLKIEKTEVDLKVRLGLNGHVHTIHKALYLRLTRLAGSSSTDGSIWLILTLYQLLDGNSLQWAVPPNVMWLFKEKMHCHTDIFASPLNAYNKNYYSLFYYDQLFGSKGNFFCAPDSDFRSGTFHVNPPFIVSVFQKTTERINRLLDQARKDKEILTFIYVMPDWKDFDTYNAVSMSRYRKAYTYIAPGQGQYYQYRTDNYFLTSFGTHIFFLSTDNNLPDISVELKEKFKSNTI
jgi:hypothetical protein